MSTSPALPQRHLPATAAGAILCTGLMLLLGGVGLPLHSVPPVRSDSLGLPVSGPCLGSAAPTTTGGTLVLVGSSSPLPSVVGVPVHVDYFYTEITVISGHSNASCVPTRAAGTTTGAGGAFSVPLTVPLGGCIPPVCVSYAGPYGPLGFATSGAPAGYFEQDPTSGTSPGTIGWEAYLARALVNETGPKVVSQSAPVHLSASAWDARGNPSPAPLTYWWSLAGLDWGYLSTRNATNVTVEGILGGWTGSLFVTINATFGSTTESVSSAVLYLLPADTAVHAATASPTPVDLGVPVTFSLTGSGAAGYHYSATVDPGLGGSPASGPCTQTNLPNGTVNLSCQVRTSYPVSGIANPTASITNGYSTGQLASAPLLVRPVEQVQVGGPSLVTYPNRSVELFVNVTAGTGSTPYGPACLSPGDAARMSCQFQNGTSWTFNESFPAPGRYSILGSVTDRFGENVSASTVVVVVPFLSARVNGNATITLFAYESRPLSVLVAGGVFPIATWWNLSQAAGILCSYNLISDGPGSCSFPASLPGLYNLTVTLRDALGGEASALFHISVAAAPSGSSSSGIGGLLHLSTGATVGLVGAILAGTVVAALMARRRLQAQGQNVGEPRVEEDELERMARGREHILGRADPQRPQRPDELVAGWTGPPVAPEEWAEWISALVADGSLLPSRGPDWGLVYRRAPPRPSAATIQFDPTVWEATRRPLDDDRDPSPPPEGRQGGG